MTRVLAVVAVAALVVLAGCGGAPATSTSPGGGGDGGDGGVGTETTATDVQRVTVPSELVPPGASPQRITDPATLLNSHLRALSNRTYAVESSFTKVYGPGSSGGDGTVRYRLERGAESYASSRTTVEGGAEQSKDVYVNPDEVFVRNGDGANASYQYGGGPVSLRLQQYARPAQPTPNVMYYYLGVATDVHATGYGVVDGTQVVNYRAGGYNSSKLSQFGGVLGAPNGTVEDLSLSMAVDADGVVHRASGEMTLEREDGETRERSFSYSLDTSASVDPAAPSWTSDVPRLEAALNADNDLLRVENVGNASFGNYSTTVVGNVSAETSVNGTFAPGDSAYLYATGSGNDTVLHVSDARPSVPEDARTLPGGGRVTAYFGSDAYTASVGTFKNTTDAGGNETSGNESSGNDTTENGSSGK